MPTDNSVARSPKASPHDDDREAGPLPDSWKAAARDFSARRLVQAIARICDEKLDDEAVLNGLAGALTEFTRYHSDSAALPVLFAVSVAFSFRLDRSDERAP